MTQRHRAKAFHLQAAELAITAPQVVAHRVGRMMAAGHQPSARDRQEFHRMGAEKVAAFYESWNAMAAEMLKLHTEQSLSVMRWFWSAWGQWPSPAPAQRSLQHAALDVLAAGMSPVGRRASANAKRLSRLKKR